MTYFNEFGQARLGWRTSAGGGGSTIDADAQAFITAASITDTTQQSAINTLVTQLKTYGIWTKMKALYPFVGGTASSHKWNLKDPRDLDAAYRLVFNGGWTHSTTGAKPNGTTAYADTKLTADLLTSSNHLSYYSRTSSTTGIATEIGMYNNLPTGIILQIRSAVNYVSGQVQSTVNYTTTGSALGFWIGSKRSSTDREVYLNNSSQATSTTADTNVLNPVNLYIGARNNGGIGAQQLSSKESAFASIGDGLTDTEAANFYTAVQTFQTTLGRQVGVPIVADTDAQAFLNAAVITDQTQANAVNTLVTSLKSANIWNKMKAIYPFVGGTAASHKFNLKDPRDVDAAYRLVFAGGWTHSATGALPNGTNGYADTKLNTSFNLSVNNTHTSIYCTNNITSLSSYPSFGANSNSSSSFYTSLKSSSNLYYQFIGSEGSLSYGTSYTNTDTRGFFLASRTNSTSLKSYKNDVFKNVTTLANTGTLPGVNYMYGVVGKSGGFDGATFNNYLHSFASIGDGLTDVEATAFYNAVQAYQTTLGRQV